MSASNDARRGSSAERGYGGRWQRARREFLNRPENVFCRMCLADGREVRATVVDHVTPHRGDYELMWDETNWQSLCAAHHSRDKQSFEKTGRVKGVNLDGGPTDPHHPWNARPSR